MRARFPESSSAPHPPRSFHQTRPGSRAFTLVEVVLAIGVVSFAFVGLFALLPVGLGLFREGMDTAIGAQIAQRIVSEVQQADFDALVPEDGHAIEGVSTGGSAAQFYALPLRYFDDQGTELGVENGSAIPELTPDERQRVVYMVRVRGSFPGAANPQEHDSEYFTSLPGSEAAYAGAARFNPRFVTFLTIQVVKNPGLVELDRFIDTTTFLISPSLAGQRGLSIKTFPSVVARNAYRNAS